MTGNTTPTKTPTKAASPRWKACIGLLWMATTALPAVLLGLLR